MSARKQRPGPTLVETSKQAVRDRWSSFTDAVTSGQHAVITFSRSRLTDDPNRKPIAVAVPIKWWQENLGKRQIDPDSIADSLAVHEFRPDIRVQLRRVTDDGWHLRIAWWGEPAIVIMPAADYMHWTKRAGDQSLMAEVQALE